MEIARIFMVIFHLGISIFIFKLIYKLTKNTSISLFGGIIYGINPYMLDFTRFTLSDLPAVFFFILSLYFFFDEDRKSKVISGTFSGLSFIFRPDMGILIAIIFFLNVRNEMNWKYFLPTFLFLAIFLNFISAFLVFKKPLFPPLEFIKVNFIEEKMAFQTQTTNYKNYFWFINRFFEYNKTVIPFFLLSLFSIPMKNKYYLQFLILFILFSFISIFLPKIDVRIFIKKITPVFSILVAQGLIFLRKNSFLLFVFIGLICLSTINILTSNLWFKYPVWRPEEVNYKKDGIICSNQPFIYIYINKVPAHLLSYFESRSRGKKLNLLEKEIERCNYTYLFTHREITFLQAEEIKFLNIKYKVEVHKVGDYHVYEIFSKI